MEIVCAGCGCVVDRGVVHVPRALPHRQVLARLGRAGPNLADVIDVEALE